MGRRWHAVLIAGAMLWAAVVRVEAQPQVTDELAALRGQLI